MKFAVTELSIYADHISTYVNFFINYKERWKVMEIFISHLLGAFLGIFIMIIVGCISTLIVLFLMNLGIDKR